MTNDNILNQTDIEKALVEEGRSLRRLVGAIRESAQAKAESETAFKVAFAKARLLARAGEGRVTEAFADDTAVVETEAERLKFLTADGVLMAQREELRICQSRIDALRTLMASVRSVT